ncbi:MAG: CPBP family intramembrane metalloprotease [archaeon]|nr:CPBP family intramembrane metalloprotease [archaeon]
MPVWIRIFLFLIAYAFIGGIFLLIGGLFAGIPIDDFGTNVETSLSQKLTIHFFGLLGIVLIVYIFRNFLDRKSFLSIGLSFKKRYSDLLSGFIIALIILSIGFLVLLFLKDIKIVEITFNIKVLSLSFLLYGLVALSEEFLARGYILNNLLDSINKYVAIVISSVIFSLLHIFNDNISWLSIINLFLAGLIFGAAYIYTRNLWLPISLHLFWNFIQGSILGFNVSGLNLDSLLVLDISGRTIITGGDFGFEGSILCTILELISFIGILYYFRRKNTSQPEKVMATL